MAAINARQIRTIYAVGNALGILERGVADDELHAFVAATTGKNSIKELTSAEGEAVIVALQKRQKQKPKRSGKTKEHPAVAGGITADQQRKVWALMYKLRDLDAEPNGKPLGERLCSIIKKELGVEARPQNPFVWVDFKAGAKLLETLKGYVKSAEKAAQKAGAGL